MDVSNEQVKRRGGRPPKNGKAARSSADRSREYRDRKRCLAGAGRSETACLAMVLARIVVATSERGVLSREVVNALETDIDVIKYIKQAFEHGMTTTMYIDKMRKELKSIVKHKEKEAMSDDNTRHVGFV